MIKDLILPISFSVLFYWFLWEANKDQEENNKKHWSKCMFCGGILLHGYAEVEGHEDNCPEKQKRQ